MPLACAEWSELKAIKTQQKQEKLFPLNSLGESGRALAQRLGTGHELSPARPANAPSPSVAQDGTSPNGPVVRGAHVLRGPRPYTIKLCRSPPLCVSETTAPRNPAGAAETSCPCSRRSRQCPYRPDPPPSAAAARSSGASDQRGPQKARACMGRSPGLRLWFSGKGEQTVRPFVRSESSTRSLAGTAGGRLSQARLVSIGLLLSELVGFCVFCPTAQLPWGRTQAPARGARPADRRLDPRRWPWWAREADTLPRGF